MKCLCFVIVLFCAANVFSQDFRKMPRNGRHEVEYTEVVKIDSLISNQLYFNSQAFVNAGLQSKANSTVQDEKAKMVSTRSSIPITISLRDGEFAPIDVNFTLIIQSQDRSYQYSFKDFYAGYTNENRITIQTSFNDHVGIRFNVKQWTEIELQTDAAIRRLVASLKQVMSQNSLIGTESIKVNKKKH